MSEKLVRLVLQLADDHVIDISLTEEAARCVVNNVCNRLVTTIEIGSFFVPKDKIIYIQAQDHEGKPLFSEGIPTYYPPNVNPPSTTDNTSIPQDWDWDDWDIDTF